MEKHSTPSTAAGKHQSAGAGAGKPVIFGLDADKSLLLGSVLLAMLISSLDQTIVTTAMPTVVQQLGGLKIFSWVFTVYMVTSSITIMLSGKLGDTWSRKGVYFWGIVVFLAGSVAAGLAPDMLVLILARAVQGLGAGAMMISAMSVIGEMFPPAERGRWQGVIGAVFALSAIVGPITGAAITATIGWRWVFFVNVPLGILVLVLMARAKIEQKSTRRIKLDWLGALWFSIFVFGAITYMISGFGSSDPVFLIILAASFVSLGAFVLEEMRATEPFLHLGLFRDNTFVIASASAFVVAGAMYGAITYLPLLAQEMGKSIADAGEILTYLLVAMVFSSAVSGQIMSRMSKYKIIGIAGGILLAAGLYMLSIIDAAGAYEEMRNAALFIGFGLGATMPLFVIVVQNAFENKRIGEVTSAVSFFRSLGGAVGVAMIGALLNVSFADAALGTVSASPSLLPGLHNAFGFAFAASLIPIVLMLFLKEIPLRKSHAASLGEEIGVQFVEEQAVLDEKSGAME